MSLTLAERFARSAAAHPGRPAVVDPLRGCSVSYAELGQITGEISSDLARLGVSAGRRVGLLAGKSIPGVAALLGVLERGAAYVPVNAAAPARRGVDILADCGVDGVFVERGRIGELREAWGRDLAVHELAASRRLRALGADLVLAACPGGGPSPVEGLAYILYTSGSTGKAKGVMHTQASAAAFLDWCGEVFAPGPDDRFSSHAPFCFDLSILDLFVPLGHGAAVVLLGEEEGKNPRLLAARIAESGISVWYSTPSVLRLLVEHGGLERSDAARLRLVLFAGEVFAPGHLRRLQAAWPGRRYWNLYGPTETNVCTAHEIREAVPEARAAPYPIGRPISGDEALVVDGELLVGGGTVMAGYWNRPDLDAQVFHVDADGRRWYRTGDLVRQDEHGDLVYAGRRDRMIKRRGYRVELGEIEAALYRHASIREAAVVATSDPEGGAGIRAFICWSAPEPPSIIALKRLCAEHLPLYMVPDRFTFLDVLPRTATDKIDYVRLGAS